MLIPAYSQVVGVAQSFCEVWDSVATALAELDVLLGFADLAVSAPLPYVRPQMLPATEGRLELEGCRCGGQLAECRATLVSEAG